MSAIYRKQMTFTYNIIVDPISLVTLFSSCISSSLLHSDIKKVIENEIKNRRRLVIRDLTAHSINLGTETLSFVGRTLRMNCTHYHVGQIKVAAWVMIPDV